ncbi:MAG: hypothetical protein ACI8S7_001190, partial [Candidatus Krumholzibacteriia bacterium]
MEAWVRLSVKQALHFDKESKQMIEKTHPTASASKPDSLPVGSKKNHALIMVWIIVWMASYVLFAKAATNDWFS